MDAYQDLARKLTIEQQDLMLQKGEVALKYAVSNPII